MRKPASFSRMPASQESKSAAVAMPAGSTGAAALTEDRGLLSLS
ncbi:MAG TPA: hypothetical protein PLY89_02210 [Synergistaceae bacterium]|nr:hypothetical protein [Synergistaceae bacterium]